MTNIATHRAPAWRSKANFLIRADLADFDMPARVEQLWARKVGDATFEICCVPFFTYGIALGDTVQTDRDYFVRGVLKKGGHKTLRAALTVQDNVNELHEAIHERLDSVGMTYEWHAPGYVAIDLSSTSDDTEIVTFLQNLANSGNLTLEIDE